MLQYKVYTNKHQQVAACKDFYAAMVIAVQYGVGTTVRDGHSNVIYTEQEEDYL